MNESRLENILKVAIVALFLTASFLVYKIQSVKIESAEIEKDLHQYFEPNATYRASRF